MPYGQVPSVMPWGRRQSTSASSCGFPQDPPARFEGDELSEDRIVVVGLLNWVHPLQRRLQRVDVADQLQLLQPIEDDLSVPALLVTREWLDRKPAQEAPLGLVRGGLEDRFEGAADAPGLGQGDECGPGAWHREPVLFPAGGGFLGQGRVLERELERLGLDARLARAAL